MKCQSAPWRDEDDWIEDGDFSFLHSDALKDQENNEGLFTVGYRASQETSAFFSLQGTSLQFRG